MIMPGSRRQTKDRVVILSRLLLLRADGMDATRFPACRHVLGIHAIRSAGRVRM